MANNKNKNKVLDVQNLSVNYNTGGSIFRAVKNISFSVNEGETISIVGESGSGKSTTAAALIGLLPHATGNVVLKDYTIPAAPHFIKKGFNNWMAEQMQFVFQDPFTSLNPRARVERILSEPFRTNNPFKAERKEAIQKMFHQINLLLIRSLNLKNKDRENRLIDRANVLHEDRVKLIHEAKDEIDLDEYKIKNFKAEIWQVKNTMKTKLTRFSDLALDNQRKVEKEKLDEVLSKDNKEYEEYKETLKAEAQEEIEALKQERETAKKELHIAKQKRHEVKKRLAIERKEFEDLINKFSVSTIADSPIWNVRRNKVTKTDSGWELDKTMSFKNLFKGGLIDAYDFMWIKRHLNPIYKRSRFIKKELESIISDFFNNYSRINIKRRVRERIQDKLEEVGLNGSDILKYPADFSGGQRQRIAIARAMMTEPALIIADEPISSLDVSIQAQIINLLKDLRASHNLTLVFIAHDLRMVEYISDNIAVMSKGQIVEYGKTKEVFKNPTHPYTRSLLSSIPSINTINLRLKVLEYDASKYQNEGLDLKEISLSDTHKVLSTDEWIKQWKAEAKKFVVYENTSRSQVKVKK